LHFIIINNNNINNNKNNNYNNNNVLHTGSTWLVKKKNARYKGTESVNKSCYTLISLNGKNM